MTRPNMRERLLDAGWQIVNREGFAAATTKAIAAEAGAAEGSLFKHFPTKSDLVVALVLERAGDVKGIFARLEGLVGRGSVARNLTAALADLVVFYGRLQALIAGVVHDRALRERMQAEFVETGRGPGRAHKAMARYLQAETEAGRLDATSSAEMRAMLLIGAAHERAFLALIEGETVSAAARRRFAAELVAAVLPEAA